MEYDKNSFLAGLSVGRTLKGWSGGGGGGGTSSDCKIYDIAEVYGNGGTAVYTAPVDGVLFYLGSFRNYTQLPDGMEIRVLKQFSYERNVEDGGFVGGYQAVIAARKTVSAGEELHFSLTDLGGMVLLAEPGKDVADFEFRTYRVGRDVSSSEFFIQEPNNITGFAYLSYVLSATTDSLTENITQYAIITNTKGIRGSGLYLYTNKSMSGSLPGKKHAIGVLGVKLATTNQPVLDAPSVGIFVSTPSTTNFDFTAGTKSWTSLINGYAIFVGAYRDTDGFLLSDFTILIDKTTPYTEGSYQHLVIAYKKVSANEKITWTSKSLFGGTFFVTSTDISAINYTVGTATRSTNSITFPMVAEGKFMFGIVGFIWSGGDSPNYVGKPNNASIAYWKSATAERLTTFAAVDYVQIYGDDNISFPISINSYHPEDIVGIWVEFD